MSDHSGATTGRNAADAFWGIKVITPFEFDARYVFDKVYQLINADHLVAANAQWIDAI